MSVEASLISLKYLLSLVSLFSLAILQKNTQVPSKTTPKPSILPCALFPSKLVKIVKIDVLLDFGLKNLKIFIGSKVLIYSDMKNGCKFFLKKVCKIFGG